MEAGSGDNVTMTKAVTLAKGITHTVSSKGRISANKRKYTKSDLPELIREDAEDKWSKKVIPSLILWYGKNVWSVIEEDLSHVLIVIMKAVYPVFTKLDEIKYGLPIYGLVRLMLVIHAGAVSFYLSL